jgi:AhpD family alkylhydroperoxidase
MGSCPISGTRHPVPGTRHPVSILYRVAMSDHLKRFRAFRERMNARIMEAGPLETKRFFALDTRAYDAGALDVPTKELLGLVASLVLRCDDCVTYHLVRCKEENLTDDQLREALHIGLVVGGSIVIPHLRRAMATLDDLAAERLPEA